ncbi:hypothetical protein V0R52_01180 [Pseudomonas asiatica]|uniref:hypothetical protein n=1 Tax=Pseudomonas asiatica TaxID=2219225 RepID=UPI002E7C2258|nr:hypothetical protein [Pseudomonas asiatica]MEE1914996.1 hypothetical protein [Pseudomonas asiatica]
MADEFLGALPAFGGQANAVATFVEQRATDAEASASKATENGKVQADNAASSAQSARQYAESAATQAGNAKNNADASKVYRDSAQSAAAAAQASAGLPSLAGKGGLPLVAKPDGTGVEYTSSLKRYDLDTATATTTLDMATAQVFQVDARTPRALAISNAPSATRAMTAIINITGASTITWPPGIKWDAGRLPLLGPLWTVVVLLWVGNGWVGKVGASA